MKKTLLTIISTFSITLSISAQSSQAYCTNNLQAAKCPGGYIRYIAIDSTTLHNSSTCNDTVTSYKSFTANDSMTATLTMGKTYKLRHWAWIQAKVGMWIDYNQDGAFAASEFTLLSANSSVWNADSNTITIPTTATQGLTRMRIRTRSASFSLTSTDACTYFGSAETEDYTITLENATSINENVLENSISIYPVPAKTNFSYSFTTKQRVDVTVRLLNLTGQTISTENIYSLNGKYTQNVNTSELASGIYYLQILSDGQTITRKIALTR